MKRDFRFHSLLSFSIDLFLSQPKLLTLTQITLPTQDSALFKPQSLGMCSYSLLFMHFMHFYLSFWGFLKICGFVRFLWNIWVGFCESNLIWPCIASSLHYNYVPCILDVCDYLFLLSAVRFGLGFTHDTFNLCTSHVHAFFMHTFFLFFPILSMCCVSFYSLSLSLSLSD